MQTKQSQGTYLKPEEMTLQQMCKTKINNQMNKERQDYVIGMRKALCNEHIIHDDGQLNIKYFNVKKGQYWSQLENERLILGIIEFGPCAFKEIKETWLKDYKKDKKGVDWSQTEIRLRVCRLFRYYNLDDYKDKRFKSKEEILEEAQKNKDYAISQKDKKVYVGGIYYNPPVNEYQADTFINSFFNAKQQQPQPQ